MLDFFFIFYFLQLMALAIRGREGRKTVHCLCALAAGAAGQNAVTNLRSSVARVRSGLAANLVARREVAWSDRWFVWLV